MLDHPPWTTRNRNLLYSCLHCPPLCCAPLALPPAPQAVLRSLLTPCVLQAWPFWSPPLGLPQFVSVSRAGEPCSGPVWCAGVLSRRRDGCPCPASAAWDALLSFVKDVLLTPVQLVVCNTLETFYFRLLSEVRVTSLSLCFYSFCTLECYEATKELLKIFVLRVRADVKGVGSYENRNFSMQVEMFRNTSVWGQCLNKL